MGRRWLKPVRHRRDDALARTDWARVEGLVADHYRAQGYRVEGTGTSFTGHDFDGGIDMKLHRGDEYIVVECKHWNARQVTHNAVHQLLGIMVNEAATGAILVTSGEFTNAAIRAARKLGHVQLVDGDALRAMLGPISEAPALVREPDVDWISGVPMAARKPSKGAPAPMPEVRLRDAAPALWPWLLGLAAAVVALVWLRSAEPDAASLSRYRGTAEAQLPRRDAMPVRVAPTDSPLPAPSASLYTPPVPQRAASSSRPIDPEAARAVVRRIDGVRSVIWTGDGALLVRVVPSSRPARRMGDAVCEALAALGDPAAVAGRLQNAGPRLGLTLEHACKPDRTQVALDPPRPAPPDPREARRRADEAIRVLEASTPEM